MNKNAKAWVAALRSGKYRQSRRVLTALNERGDVVGHCCLGVACVLAVEAGVIESPRLGDGYLLYDNKHFSLPLAVQDWLGLKQNEGGYQHPPGEVSCLSALNDRGDSFESIADVIASEPKGLFV